MRQIPLGQGKVALVDDEDYPVISRFTWSAHCDTSKHWTARTTIGERGRKVYMHQLVTGKVHMDHINRNALDNRKENLRESTKLIQYANQGPKKGRQYKGVLQKPGGSWRACIGVGNHKTRYLGAYITVEEAARAYDKAARELWGEYAYQNFPKEHSFVDSHRTDPN